MPQGGQRQGGEQLFLLAGGNDAVAAEARRRPGRARRRGKPGADIETLLEEARQDVVQHGALAAEQMGAAGDVEEKPVRAVERHQRRVAVAPVGEAFEQPAVGLRIGLDDVDRGMHGARVGNAHAALQLQRLSPLVEGDMRWALLSRWLITSGK